eukprot:scaffold74136_cov61-Attheya_sp.AAC.4
MNTQAMGVNVGSIGEGCMQCCDVPDGVEVVCKQPQVKVRERRLGSLARQRSVARFQSRSVNPCRKCHEMAEFLSDSRSERWHHWPSGGAEQHSS